MRKSGESQFLTIQAAWHRYLAVMAVLSSIVVFAILVGWPWSYERAVEHFLLPQLESRFGFTGGGVPVSPYNDRYEIYGIVSVRPGGVLDLAGAKAGDIPFDRDAHRTPAIVLYEALSRFDAGKRSQFDVVGQDEWNPWYAKPRRIELVPQSGRR